MRARLRARLGWSSQASIKWLARALKRRAKVLGNPDYVPHSHEAGTDPGSRLSKNDISNRDRTAKPLLEPSNKDRTEGRSRYCESHN
jgi:hypothetical protein